MTAKLRSEYNTGANIVAVAEAAGNTQNLVLIEQSRRFEQPKDVHAIGTASGRVEGEGSFDVAIRSRGPEDTNTW